MRQKGFVPIIILFIVVLLGALSYFTFTKGYITQLISKNNIQKSITPAPYPINTKPPNTPDPTANWITYKRGDDGFYTIKVPKSWRVWQSDNGQASTMFIQSENFKETNEYDGNIKITIIVENIRKPTGMVSEKDFVNDIEAEKYIVDDEIIYFFEVTDPKSKVKVPIKIQIYKNDPEINLVNEILDTLKFDPSEESLKNAITIT